MIIKHRRGLATEWAAKNPVVHAGEIGVETDTNRFKIGSGIHVWSELPYYQTTDEFHAQVAAYLEQIETTGGENSALITQLRDDAIAAKNDAVAAKTAAEAVLAAASTAPFGGTSLGTADLNTIITPGIYRQDNPTEATVIRNYPRENMGAVLEVLRINTPNIEQRLSLIIGTSTTNVVTYVRRRAFGVWESWRVLPSFNIDNPVGGVSVKVWDHFSNTDRSLLVTEVPLGVLDLNTVTTPGTYSQGTAANATVARNYPKGGGAWVLEVSKSSVLGTVQRLVRHWQNGWMEPRGFWMRSLNGGSGWTTWQFYGSQRVDNTAGRAIYTWDDTANREQLIYGDTGIRNITTLFPVKDDVTAVAAAYILRERYTVTLGLVGVTKTGTGGITYTVIPQGFLPAFTQSVSSGPLRLTAVSDGRAIISGATTNGEITLSWRTNQPWPTTLPGGVSGAIPNL